MLNLIPKPLYVNIIDKTTYLFKHIALDNNSLSDAAKSDFLTFCNMPSGDANVLFEEDSSLEDEEYCIKTGERITIAASGMAGQFYALQTLKQILFQYNFNIPHIEIKDKPKYEIRGFMLDVGRYFFSVNDVKTMLRRMAAHKLNFFHFHLTEDQGCVLK